MFDALALDDNDFPYEQQRNSVLLTLDSGKCKVEVGLADGESAFSIVRGDPSSTRGWRSQHYGDREPALSVLLETDRPRGYFWTFFGFEKDVVHLHGETFKLVSRDLTASINLKSMVLTST